MRPRLDPTRWDLLVASVLLPVAELQVLLTGPYDAGWLLPAAAAAVVTGSVAIRRRWPAAVGFGVHGVMVAMLPVARLPAGAVTIGWFCALYALTVWTRRWWFVSGLVFFAATDFSLAIGSIDDVEQAVPFTVGAIVVMLLVRRIVGDREARLRVAVRERDVTAREAVVEERARIARELHDVIAHHVSMMVVQAGAERRVLGDERESTSEVLVLIEQIGRGALTETRRLVGMLRGDDSDALSPQPGIGDLPLLVDQMRDAGLPVDLRVDGEPRELPVGIELSAYRIVQEGLTNALKHAGSVPASVHVHYGPRELALEIADVGDGSAEAVDGGGHGLVGIRERVALYGGAFHAGRRPGGGFAIRVLLPVG